PSSTLSLHDALPISLDRATATEREGASAGAEIERVACVIQSAGERHNTAILGLDRPERVPVAGQGNGGARDIGYDGAEVGDGVVDRKSTRLNSSHT